MQLTDEQVEAAQAQGCRFIAATEAQVQQFSMQRRVFQMGEKPFLATRQNGFYETAGTLMALVAEAMRLQEEATAPAPEKGQAPDAAPRARRQARRLPMAPPTPPPPPVPLSAGRQAQLLAAMAVIARGYAQGHAVPAAELGPLLSSVHHTLRGLG